MMPASLRGVLTGPLSVATMRLAPLAAVDGRATTGRPPRGGRRPPRKAGAPPPAHTELSPAAGAPRPAKEAGPPPAPPDVAVARHFCVDLAAQVDFERRIECDEAID